MDSRKVKKISLVFCPFFGKENKADWMKVFDDLITRGLKEVLIVISDDFPGIIDAVKLAYPLADLELAFVHLQ
ncbi:transposase [Caldicellulosiruptor bescii]|uniref:transposase n=1 Tax=Caldicellulosiruptor bescii TaxID=31899 RepID=UPI0038B7BF84